MVTVGESSSGWTYRPIRRRPARRFSGREVSIPGPSIRRYPESGPLGVVSVQEETISMRYALLIYAAQIDPSTVPPEQQQARMHEYDTFTKDIVERGLFKAGDALQPTPTATTVRVRDGKTLVTDGPFAETKEALGGFYVVDVKNLDDALELAARIPDVRNGSIE